MCQMALLCVLSSVWASNAEDLAREFNSRLRAAQLTETQTDAVRKLCEVYSDDIAELERKAALTWMQKQHRDQAIFRAVMAGRRGASARSFLFSAAQPTAEQRWAGLEILRRRLELERRIDALLTDAQKERLVEDVPEVDSAAQYSGFIVVRLSSALSPVPRDARTLDDVAAALNLSDLQAVLKEYDLTKSRRSIRALPIEPVPNKADPDRKAALLRRLASYWRIDFRGRDDIVADVLARLNRLDSVDLAYRERNVGDPSLKGPNLSDEPYAFRQGYLTAAPVGIDAVSAWGEPNGDGRGVGIVDVEKSWNPNHQDLARKCPLLIHGDIKHGSDHGTAALGEVVADDNSIGVIGVAPCAAYVYLSSWYHADGSGPNVGEAIAVGLNLMCPGDILQLEVQCEGSQIPIEDDDLVFDMIQLAVLYGMIVVEAAGNGGADLDVHINDGKKIFNRASSDFRDSGAILVGGSRPRNNHQRASWSCFGSRVDCFAWGEFVTSLGFFKRPELDEGGGDPNKTYTKHFHGTSSAVPIISGAAMILQGMAKANTGKIITPDAMRKMLSDPGAGTLQGSGITGSIGVMPNLKEVISENRPLVGQVSAQRGASPLSVVGPPSPSPGSAFNAPPVSGRQAVSDSQ